MIREFTINVDGKSIAAKSSGSGKDAIVFIHGGSMSSSTWLHQLTNEELKKKYHMIAIDLPGHGNSEWLPESEYGLKPMTGIVTRLLEKLDLNRFLLAGLSYGTLVIGEMTMPLKHCLGILLISPCIVNDKVTPAEIISPGPFGHIMAADNPPDDELNEFIRYVMVDKETGNRCFHDYRRTDPAFRHKLATSTLAGGWGDELKNITERDVPVCVVFGTEERLIRSDYLDTYPPLWNKKVYRIEKAGHVANEENAERFNPVLIDFADSVFK